MNENSENEQRNEASKLDGWANIIGASGGVISSVGGLFGKGPQSAEAQQQLVVVKEEENKKKTNKLLIYGGGALLLIVILIMFKKK